MFNPSSMTVEEAFSTLKDITFIVGTVILGWKARSWFQPVLDFFKRANEFMTASSCHMTSMECKMDLLLENHLTHIQAELKRLSREPVEISPAENYDAS